MTQQPIILTGFMSSGKTTVAKALGDRWHRRVTDLDEAIAAREGKEAWEIIDTDGEYLFRIIETKVLEEVLKKGDAEVISLGGGTWIREQNRSLILQHNPISIWLDVPFEVCWSRIKVAEHRRPLAVNEQLTQKLYELRKKQYSLSDIQVVITSATTVEEIVDEIDRAVQSKRGAAS